MIVAPISTYFYALEYFNGNSTHSAVAAVVATNLVMAAYVIVAFLENTEDPKSSKKNE